jgi:hypothetical protein
MPLPLIPLIAGQGVRLLGTHALRHVAAAEAFNLGESVLTKRAMPFLGEALQIGSNFLPGRSTLASAVTALNTPSMMGSLLGKADILSELSAKGLKELAGKALPGAAGTMGLLTAIQQASSLFTSNNDANSFLNSMSKIDLPSLLSAAGETGSNILPAIADTISELLKTALVHLDRFRQELPAASHQPDQGPR